MDPPFNIGEEYEGYTDDIPEGEYLRRLKGWLRSAELALREDGSLWLNLPDRWAAEAVVYCKDIGLTLENWCIWHYRFAQCIPNRFLRSKSHALWFSKGSPCVWPERARVPSDRATLYDDARIFDTGRGGTRMDFDVWGFETYWGRVQGNNLERVNTSPNQLPEKYLERVIQVCTERGDLVVDPFAGSGTTATVALALGRNCITGDINEKTATRASIRVSTGAVRVSEDT
jgi:site-specific DNA-methyltransferase (adenine-specific)